MLAAASLALNQAGEGSSPSGPTGRNDEARNPKLPIGIRHSGFFRHSSFVIRHLKRTHDVAAACLLAMQEVRVQLPLGALWDLKFGISDLRSADDPRVGKLGNPPGLGPGERRFKSDRADSGRRKAW